MSKENKLALVLGFGLILFVGILISDHFSAARTDQAADLAGVVDPLVESRRSNARLIEYPLPEQAAQTAALSQRSQGRPAIAPGHIADPVASSGDVRPVNDRPAQIVMGEPTVRQVGLPPEQARQLPYTPHHVAEGESLTSICRAYYGDTSLLDDLARYNGIVNPDLLRVGHRLRIPAAEGLVRGTARPVETRSRSGQDSGQSAQQRTYVIRSGDVLSVIAQRELGSADRYLELYELNRDVLEDPDHLIVGTRIRLPG